MREKKKKKDVKGVKKRAEKRRHFGDGEAEKRDGGRAFCFFFMGPMKRERKDSSRTRV